MTLDPALAGHETTPEHGTITAAAVRQFAAAIGDDSAIYRDEAAARAAGFTAIPAPPTFVTRFRVAFAEAGLDVEHVQVLHGEQEYRYTRPLYVGDALSVRHRVDSIRQSSKGGMAIMSFEQQCDAPSGERILTGRATVIVRDAAAVRMGGQEASAAAPRAAARELVGEPIPALTKQVSQAQINAYADISGDHNPIHINAEQARAVGLNGTIAHGMLSMAFAGQLVTRWLTQRPGQRLARLRVRFLAMVRPGDTLTCRGVLAGARDGSQRVDLWIDNARGERVLTGDADVAGGPR